MRLPRYRSFNPWTRQTERRRSLWRRLTPPQLFVSSFLALVLLGTAGLRLLPGLYTGERLSWLDALFTATSAVCVTGLIVVDTATFFTPLGQAFLLLLIQLGGLGMITFTTLIILALGRRLSLRHERLSSMATDVAPDIPAERMTRDVVLFTFGIEAIGAVLLWLAWGPRLGWLDAAWPAVFHSVSAFCNAGFSTFSDSLIGFQSSPFTLLVVMLLLLTGGTGFLTMEEVRYWWRARREARGFRVSLHSRVALLTTAVLLAGGWVLFAVSEWNATLAGMGLVDRLSNALFLSATPRTAGFNSIDYARAAESTNFLTILFMFVGGSPGSTAGGVKTTTVALVLLLAWTRFRGRDHPSLWGRTIPEETMERAVGLSVVAFGLVTIAILVLTWSERARGLPPGVTETRFLSHMFEAVSAFNTVGLSMGVTATLSALGKWITLVLMFIGRVGPLTFAAALALAPERQDVNYRYAYEDVVVG